jgi:hypothetical protein
MADPYRENKSGIYSVMPENSHSQIDDLIAVNDLQQISSPSRLKELLFGPQDFEYEAGYAPDIALSPLIAGKSIMSILKNLFKGKSKSKIGEGYGQGSSRYIDSQLKEALRATFNPSYPLTPSKITSKPQNELKRILEEVGFKEPKKVPSSGIVPKIKW